MGKRLFKIYCFLILSVALLLNACGGSGGSNSSCGSCAGTTKADQNPILIYLQAVTAERVYVMIESQSDESLTVDYGLTTGYGSTAVSEGTKLTTAGTYIHRIPLSGLTPETTYYYRFGDHSASFTTAANPGASFRFAWLADTRSGTAVHDAIARFILAENPTFSLYGGDLCDDGSYNVYKEQFFRTDQMALAAKVPFFNATGNHEEWGTNTKAFMQAPESVSGNQGYYSFDYGDLHVVVMNYMDPGGYAEGSPQYNFIAADLTATKKVWKVVICHAPGYAAGGHGEDINLIALATKILEPAGVDLVISGHNHFYQRNFVNGVYHLVIGSAGAPLYTPGPVNYPEGYTQVSLQSYCWAIFDLTPASLQMRVYDEQGTQIDTLTLSK